MLIEFLTQTFLEHFLVSVPFSFHLLDQSQGIGTGLRNPGVEKSEVPGVFTQRSTGCLFQSPSELGNQT